MTAHDLRTLRASANWTQARLAAALGKSPVTISQWENGARAIPRAEEIAIRAVLRGGPEQQREHD